MSNRKQKKVRMVHQIDETKGGILKTAKQIFTERGLFDPQMQDIAKGANISRSTLYRYFQDKSDLAMAVFDNLVKEIMTAIVPASEELLKRKDLSGLEKLNHYLNETWLSHKFDKEMKFIAEFDTYFTGSRIPEDFRKRISAVFGTPEDTTLISCLQEGIKDGSVDPGIDIHLTMVSIINAISATRQRIILRENILVELKKEQGKDLTEELMRLLIKGLSNK